MLLYEILKTALVRVLTSASLRVLDLWISATGHQIRTASEELAYDIECQLGLRRGAVQIHMKRCADGSILPTIELRDDLTPQQFAAVEGALEKLRGVRTNTRPPPRAFN